MISNQPAAVIEAVTPLIEGGRYPIKRVVGEDLLVQADVFKDGHDVVTAVLKWRKTGDSYWFETPMAPLVNDRWEATCSLFENATYEYTIDAWGDTFRTWQHEFHKKFEAGLTDLSSEILEGAHFVEAAAKRAAGTPDGERLIEIAKKIKIGTAVDVDQIAHWTELEVLMATWPDRSMSTEYKVADGAGHRYPRVEVDRERAKFAAWYEFFPRSAEGKADSGNGTGGNERTTHGQAPWAFHRDFEVSIDRGAVNSS